MKFRQLDEEIDYIVGGATVEEQIARAREIQASDSAFIPIIRMGVDPAEKIEGIPVGAPSTYKPEKDMPEGISETTARQELRRWKNFKRGGTVQNLSSIKRETLWIQLLEGLHWKEAAVMTMIKDQTLLENYPILRDVLPSFGIEVPAEVKAKAKKTKRVKEVVQ